jgi:biotin carboxylase
LTETERFRDKFIMCSRVDAAGHRVPPFTLAPDRETVTAFGAKHGWPVIIKPCNAHSSKGVQKIDDPAGLDDVDFAEGQRLLVQHFNPHPIYYVDGVLRDGQLGPWRASRYLNSCLDFRNGDFVGAVEEDDPDLTTLIAAHTLRFLAALTDGPLVFHLELFVEPGADGPVCSFLEVGARAGGAEIPYLWREIHGYDLMHAVAEVQLGHEPAPAPHDDNQIAGLLLTPAPAARPCRVTDVTSMTARQPGPYTEIIAHIGEIIPAGESVFEQVAGRFRFRGPSSHEVEAAIVSTLADFRVHAEAIA